MCLTISAATVLNIIYLAIIEISPALMEILILKLMLMVTLVKLLVIITVAKET